MRAASSRLHDARWQYRVLNNSSKNCRPISFPQVSWGGFWIDRRAERPPIPRRRTSVRRCTMARITVIPDDSWDGELGELHPRVVDRAYGRVDNILAIHSLNPRSMAAHQGVYESAMAGTATLRKAEREVVGYYAYANRIADGLGLQTESWIPD